MSVGSGFTTCTSSLLVALTILLTSLGQYSQHKLNVSPSDAWGQPKSIPIWEWVQWKLAEASPSHLGSPGSGALDHACECWTPAGAPHQVTWIAPTKDVVGLISPVTVGCQPVTFEVAIAAASV
ncbi:hypothetical protein CDL15_Pgr003377 [Punica granatum]|uniref:Uncharacterized protein n=1 Tax=Punica granatum TaxID=22663 RepID=A0A218X1X8_PUNGR|nr:hypothetical protein CDL15_Pgr003377 [Punica granatum]PKI33523.1 hypothetical protein CRG98_046079 [Punica granatum]